MPRTTIDENADDRLFSILDATQGLQRRLYRIRSRGFFNIHSINEMLHQANSLSNDVKALAEMAEGED